MVRRTASVVVLLTLLAACTDGRPQPEADPGPTPTPTSATPTEEALPCVPGAEPFTGPAAEELGADEVMEAYCMLAGLAYAQVNTSLALPVPEQERRDLRPVQARLAPEVRTRWAALVRDRATEPSEIDGLTLHDVRRVPQGYQRADDGPFVFGTTVGPATAALQGDALSLTFTLETGLVLEESGDDTGRHSLLPVTRTGTYVLVPDGDRWAVADWDVSFEHGPVRLVSG